MSDHGIALFKGTAQGLFSSLEIQRLMRIEFERSQRYRLPVVLLLITIDRLSQLQDLYGVGVKDEIMRGLVHRLRSSTRSSDLLAVTIDDRLLVLVPQTPAEGVAAMARRILKDARSLELECDGRPMRVSVSIGGSHNHRRDEVTFETMMEVAEGGNEVAQKGGGDRYVHSELYDFFQKKRDRDVRAAAPAAAAAGQPIDLANLGPSIGALLGDKIRELFGISPGERIIAGIERDVTAQLLRELRERKETADAAGEPAAEQEDYQRKIDLLERRISKLTKQLGMTEEQLQNVLRMKTVDPGIASIYSTVQGISQSEAQSELKRELMSKIFEANMELRRKKSAQQN